MWFELHSERGVATAQAGGEGPAALTQIEQSLEAVRTAVQQMIGVQTHWRNREAQHRHMARAMNWRVHGGWPRLMGPWCLRPAHASLTATSAAELMLVVVLCVIQVGYLKGLLTRRSRGPVL